MGFGNLYVNINKKQIIAFLLLFLLAVSAALVLAYWDEIAGYLFQDKEQRRLAKIKGETEECVADFDLKNVPADDESRNKEDLAKYALCRAQILKSRKECDVLTGLNKEVCSGDANDFVTVTSLAGFFFEDAEKEFPCSEETLNTCDSLAGGLFADEYLVSSEVKGKFCGEVCAAFKKRDAAGLAAIIHGTFARKTPLGTPTEPPEKTRRDIAALLDLNADNCDLSVAGGIDCKNEIHYLNAWQLKDKTVCDKISDVGGVMKGVFKDLCVARFEDNEVGYCDRYLDDHKYNYCSEKAIAENQ